MGIENVPSFSNLDDNNITEIWTKRHECTTIRLSIPRKKFYYKYISRFQKYF